MNSVKYVVGIVAAFSLTGCAGSGGAPDSEESTPSVTGNSEQAVTLVDCQKQVTACVKGARSFLDLGGCTAKFQGCTTQAAVDLVGQGNLLKNCRASANACLEGALTMGEIKACRSVFDSCAGDVQGVATNGIKDALGAAKDAITQATNAAIGVIDGASGVATGALDAVNTCSTQAQSCLAGAITLNGITACRASFEKCAGAAVSLVDDIASTLPLPTPKEIATTLAPCQDKAGQCLAGAVTATDISACKGTLQTCVKGVTSVADSAVNDVNKLLPPIIQLPTPTKAVDCTTATADCLLKLGNPFECATATAKCLGA